jgi:bifunctional aspartokinase / homoserine dehydrogenase 1
MKVLKFGGTSVKNATNINKVINIVKASLSTGESFVVVSALGGITNKLLEASKTAASGDNSYTQIFKDIEQAHTQTATELIQDPGRRHTCLGRIRSILKELDDLLHGIYLIKEISPRTSDIICSFGERLSAYIVAQAFAESGIAASDLDARETIVTDNNFGNAQVDFCATNKKIAEAYNKSKGRLIVATGFIGATPNGETTTLGRGGSDYSAAIFAGALSSTVLEIWTDVSGMYTADPRKVKKAFPIEQISYPEAMELSHFGAKVLEPRTVLPAMSKKIPVHIKNTFDPQAPGTLILDKVPPVSGKNLRGISSIDKVSLITVQGSGMIGKSGVSARIFLAMSKQSVNIILITQGSSEHSISFAVLPSDSSFARTSLEKEFELELQVGLIEPIRVEENLTVIAAVGENMKNISGISGRFFEALGRNGVNVAAIAQGASELNISVVINSVHETKALNAVHEAFFLSDVQTLNVFIVGTGIIGGTLLKQIAAQREVLAEKNKIDVKAAGILNLDGFVIDKEGIDLSCWEETLKAKGDKTGLAAFVDAIIAADLRNSVFVDNTASKDVADNYEKLIDKSISVVTPNKIANASPYERYQALHSKVAHSGAKFLYETNVGAGLPILSTLKDLINSGDQVLKMEAILSGSLNFIFSSLSSGSDFAGAVKKARELGFTEPDPTIDLSGMDVARKILILSREIGYKFDISDIQVENCLTAESQKATGIDELWASLETYDNPAMSKRIEEAAASGKRLKYIATYENGKSYTSIKAVGPDHPFYNIQGSDNIIAFTTSRYKTNPLIVIGPGAGAEVTAAGVFADVIRIVNF